MSMAADERRPVATRKLVLPPMPSRASRCDDRKRAKGESGDGARMSEQSRLTERIRRLATRRDATVRASSGHSAPSSRMRRIGSLGGLALVVVLSAQFVVVLDFSIVNVALPSISRELRA